MLIVRVCFPYQTVSRPKQLQTALERLAAAWCLRALGLSWQRTVRRGEGGGLLEGLIIQTFHLLKRLEEHLLLFISPLNAHLLLGKSGHSYGVREKWGWRGERYKGFTEPALLGRAYIFRFVLEAEKRSFTWWNWKFPAVRRWRRAFESKYEAVRLRKVT